MMGAGKSTTGYLLSSRLGWPYLDSDAEIERQTGRTVPEIWKADGEPAFRREESRVLAEAASSPVPVVISVAGGAVLDGANRALIRAAGLVVWLRARVETLAERVGSGLGRPLLEGQVDDNLGRLQRERWPLYEEIADVAFDVDTLSPSQVVERVMASLDGWEARRS